MRSILLRLFRKQIQHIFLGWFRNLPTNKNLKIIKTKSRRHAAHLAEAVPKTNTANVAEAVPKFSENKYSLFCWGCSEAFLLIETNIGRWGWPGVSLRLETVLSWTVHTSTCDNPHDQSRLESDSSSYSLLVARTTGSALTLLSWDSDSYSIAWPTTTTHPRNADWKHARLKALPANEPINAEWKPPHETVSTNNNSGGI